VEPQLASVPFLAPPVLRRALCWPALSAHGRACRGERMTAVARRTSPLVAIFNSRDEVIEAIRSALENDGSATVTARLAEIQNGTLDLVAFIKVHAPDVIVYDLPRPYESHWN